MSDHCRVEFTDTTVVKTYQDPDRYHTELAAYTQLSDFTPRLLDHDDTSHTLVAERCIPILEIPRWESVVYRKPLWELLQGLHEAGWWHRDACLVNVVVHYGRPLLIDWENACPATAPDSYDLWGATTIGVESAWGHPYSVHWHNLCRCCPAQYWRCSPRMRG